MYITIDIGGTNFRMTKYRTLDPNSIIEKIVLPGDTIKLYSEGLKLIHNNIRKLILDDNLEGVGVSMSGEVDSNNGVMLDSQFYPDWNDRNLSNDLSNILQTEVRFENDAVAAGLAEKAFGFGKDYAKYAYISLGTGIGGTVIVEQDDCFQVYPTEIGHIIVNLDGEKCICGHKGCVEAYSSGEGIYSITGTNAHIMEDKEVWTLASRYLTQALMNFLLIYPVDLIVFGGGMASNQVDFLKRFVISIENLLGKKSTSRLPEFNISKFGETTGSLGGLALYEINKSIKNMRL